MKKIEAETRHLKPFHFNKASAVLINTCSCIQSFMSAQIIWSDLHYSYQIILSLCIGKADGGNFAGVASIRRDSREPGAGGVWGRAVSHAVPLLQFLMARLVGLNTRAANQARENEISGARV